MRKPFIAGNWKMHKTAGDAVKFIKKLKKKEIPSDRDVLLCPTFTCLSEAYKAIKDSKIKLGSQNMHFEEKGAFTGEISALMLKEIGVEYVILGHSERRHIFNEDDEFINKKVKSALEHGLKPILCVGETLKERKKGQMKEVVSKQIVSGLQGVSKLDDVVIAYEPVWAIGTGVNATPEEAEEAHSLIRKLVAREFSKKEADELRILYGGSVKPENVKDIMKQEDVDGVLVGGASLDVEKFYELIKFDQN
jgi:triosephosphate isomerase